MEIARLTQKQLQTRLTENDGAQQSWHEIRQPESTVEVVGGFSQIAAREFGLLDCVAAAADGSPDVRRRDIDPACPLDLGGCEAAFGLQHGVRVASVAEPTKASQQPQAGQPRATAPHTPASDSPWANTTGTRASADLSDELFNSRRLVNCAMLIAMTHLRVGSGRSVRLVPLTA